MPLELADLARGDPPTLEREQLAALRAFHPRQQPGRVIGRQSPGGSLEHQRASTREADRRPLLAQLRERHLTRLRHPRLDPLCVAVAGCSTAGTRSSSMLATRNA
jgi:hypothetical protein